jgi:hypothetical protein
MTTALQPRPGACGAGPECEGSACVHLRWRAPVRTLRQCRHSRGEGRPCVFGVLPSQPKGRERGREAPAEGEGS